MGIQHIIYLYFTQEVYVRRNKGEMLHKPASTRVLPIIRCWDFRNGWNGVRIQSEIFQFVQHSRYFELAQNAWHTGLNIYSARTSS